MAQSHARPYVVRVDSDVLDFSPTFWDDLTFLREHDIAPILVAPDRSTARAVVQRINRASNTAVGLSGCDAGILPTRGESLGAVQTGLLQMLLENGYVPVLEPTGFAPFQGDIAVDADSVAAKIGAALAAVRAFFFMPSGGVIDPVTLAAIADLTPAEALMLAEDDRLDARLRSVMRAAALGVRGGVAAAQIVDGRMAHAVIAEHLTHKHVGTEVRGALFLGDYVE